MSTVGTASATESHIGDDTRTAPGDREEDLLSTDTNYRESGSVTSVGADPDAMDEDFDGVGTRSVGGYDDRMSDDGSASLVGFGEGAGSTVSGPIYHRRPIPGAANAHQAYIGGLERTNSGLSDARREREIASGNDGPINASAIQERREASMMNGVATDTPSATQLADQEAFVDTTFRGPVSVGQPSHIRETAETIISRLDSGEGSTAQNTLGSPGTGAERLGKFYFEGGKRDE
jgi:hypothetical protein